jgi:hypothetical protein
MLAGRNQGNGPHRLTQSDQVSGVLSFIGNAISAVATVEQGGRLFDIMRLPSGEGKVQPLPQRSDYAVNLAGEAAPTAAQGLRRLAALLGRSACRTGMGPKDRAVEPQPLQLGISRKVSVQLRPAASLTPARQALVDPVPFPVLLGQQFPRRAAAHDPEDGADEQQWFAFVADVEAWTTWPKAHNACQKPAAPVI